jgi:glycerol-3-phosphate dehydrogenase
MLSRKERIGQIKKNPEISVLIVGAGINGIGTFRDLALQGVDVLIVDRGDYCSGASAATSHMVHGGIRYLENGEFRLVREAVRERNRLIENAPHLVKPLPTTFPIFKWFSGLLNAPLKFLGWLDRPAERGAVVIKIGMILYDLYTRAQKTVPRHVFRNRKQSLKLFPALNNDILFTGTYFDGSMPSPERIGIELLTDAVDENENAIPLNYMSLVSIQNDAVALLNEIDGELIHVKPKIVINAGGPWIDRINSSLGVNTQYIGGTMGSHLVLDHAELREAIGGNEFFFENEDGRIVLIFPLKDRVLIGTSDIRIEDTDDAVVTEEEVDYFFDMIKRVFPGLDMDRSNIVFTFSGVRPLPFTDANTTGLISRDHKIEFIEPGDRVNFPIYSLVGGKWTSFRAFSQEMCDVVLKQLELSRKLVTDHMPIGGGKGYPKSDEEKEHLFSKVLKEHHISRARLESLFEIYGTGVVEMLEYCGRDEDSLLQNYAEMSVGEIEFIIKNEDVVHLDDLILRRTFIGMLGRTSKSGLGELANITARTLGWSEERKEMEIDLMIQILKTKHRMHFSKYLAVKESKIL